MMDPLPIVDQTAIARLTRLGGARLVHDMIDLFVTHGAERMAALQEGAASGDAAEVERAAHSLKSSAGNLGARQLQHTAEMVEAMAADGVLDSELLARMAREHEASVEALRAVREAGEA